jgi:ABC-type transport system substrate-binding protein
MGFNLELVGVDYSTLESTIFGDAPAEEQPFFINWGWWPDYNDPWNQLYPNFTADAVDGGGSNAGDWINERFEEIMAEAAQYEDENRLNELMKEAQQILTELDPPVIYQGQLRWYTILGNDIQGFVPNGLYLGAFPFHKMSRASG